MEFNNVKSSVMQITNEECIEMLDKAAAGLLALSDEDGYPYTVPVNFVYSEGCIYLHSASESFRANAMGESSRVGFSVILRDTIEPETFLTGYDSVLCLGQIRVVADGDEKQKAVSELVLKYTKEIPNNVEHYAQEIQTFYMQTPILRLDIVCMTGKNSGTKMKVGRGDTPSQEKKVTGIGGIFFKTKDPIATRKWYEEHLGIPDTPYGYSFEWYEQKDSDRISTTVWSPFPESSDYFGDNNQEYMINYRVQNLERLAVQLREQGVTILDSVEDYEGIGRFLHILDVDARRIELWEPL